MRKGRFKLRAVRWAASEMSLSSAAEGSSVVDNERKEPEDSELGVRLAGNQAA